MTFGLEHVHVAFGDHDAIGGVDLRAPAGTVVAVVGGDGAGKSTLLRCLAGQQPPTHGRVRRPGRRRLGYMPATSGTWRQLTVDENIDFIGSAFDMPSADLERRRRELLASAGLEDVGGRPAGALSGGMRQKLGFVLATLHEPDLLVLDEPSTGVDPVSRVEMWRLIAGAAASGAAVVMATSYIDEAERAGSIVVLDDGRSVVAGDRDEIMSTFPGVVVEPARAERAERSWRRGRSLREWYPSSKAAPSDASMVGRDDMVFEDAVIAHLLGERLSIPQEVGS